MANNIITNTWNSIKNIFWMPDTPINVKPTNNSDITQAYARNFGGSKDVEHNLNVFRSPIDIPRIKQDMANWRLAISEAERQIYPYRYIQQQMYKDTMLDGHIVSCWNRRVEMSLLKNFKIKSKDTGEEYEEWSDYFKNAFFPTFIKYALDSKLYGYSLISMGDIIDDVFENIVIIRRGNINPDTHLVTPVPRTTNGIDFTQAPYSDWMIWVPTLNEHAESNCGMGLLYILSPLAIRLKNNLTYNVDYNMKFGMPFRFMTTNDKNETEKIKKQKFLENMGDSGWMIADKDDTLEFIQGNSNKGYQAYEDLERRLQQMISKIILGHADALDSTTGKLGSSQGIKGIAGSPQEQALTDISTSDGNFLQHIIEKDLFRIIRIHGIKSNGKELPIDAEFIWDNDKEKAEQETARNDENIKVVNILTQLKNIGYSMELEDIEELMELKLVKSEIKETENMTENEIQNYYNSMKTNDTRFTKWKENQDGKKKPNSVSDAEWERYKIDREYLKLTKGFPDKRGGMDKEDYAHYSKLIKHKIDNNIPLDLEEGEDCCLHIGCGCSIIQDSKTKKDRWIFSTGTEEPAETTCKLCIEASKFYNK